MYINITCLNCLCVLLHDRGSDCLEIDNNMFNIKTNFTLKFCFFVENICGYGLKTLIYNTVEKSSLLFYVSLIDVNKNEAYAFELC